MKTMKIHEKKKAILDLFEQNPKKPFTYPQIAKLTGISSSECHVIIDKRFKKIPGQFHIDGTERKCYTVSYVGTRIKELYEDCAMSKEEKNQTRKKPIMRILNYLEKNVQDDFVENQEDRYYREFDTEDEMEEIINSSPNHTPRHYE